MNALVRSLGGLAAATALVWAVATPANAAIVDVKIGNAAAPGRLLTAGPGDLVSMQAPGAGRQIWVKSGTNPGFATYKIQDHCLTGRAGMVTMEPCVAGHPAQQWRTSGDALIMHSTGESATLVGARVLLQPFTGQPTQRWPQSIA
jgi:hypothetical protein